MAFWRNADPDRPLAEIAVLDLLRRITRGATHSANNAFAAALGLLAELEDEAPAALAASLAAVRAEIERAVRSGRAVMRGYELAAPASDETDLARMVADAAGVLRETLSSRTVLEVSGATHLLLVEADPAALERLVLTLSYRLCELAPGDALLEIRTEPSEKDGAAWLDLELRADDLPTAAAREMLDPGVAGSSCAGLALESVLRSVADCGGEISAASIPSGIRVRCTLPVLDV